MHKICSLENLREGFRQVKRNKGCPGIDRQTITEFEAQLDQNLAKLAQELRTGKYRPQPVHRIWIPKPGRSEKRPLGIPTVRDRVVQAAIRNVVEPIFEPGFAEQSYGFRPGRGCLDAVLLVDALLKAGHTYVLDADIKSCFDSIPHEPLLNLVEAKIKDERIINLIRKFLVAGVMENGAALWVPQHGTPQGGVISPLLSNIYLDPLDHLVERLGFEMVRYADDFMIMCRSHSKAVAAREIAGDWLTKRGLTLHPVKTHIVDFMLPEAFIFLGYHFHQDQRQPGEKSLNNLKQSLWKKTRRSRTGDLATIIQETNETLRGWFEYFKFSTGSFQDLDIWVMGRLRGILRKWKGGKGSKGLNQKSWPDSFFTDQGLFSLSAAHSGISLCWR